MTNTTSNYYISADHIEAGEFGPKFEGFIHETFDNHEEYIDTLNSILNTQEESYMMGKTYTWRGNMVNKLTYGVEGSAVVVLEETV